MPQGPDMNAIVCTGEGGADVLSLSQVARPEPGASEFLIEVEAAGINRPDIIQRQGLYPAPKGHSPLLGLEVAGTIVASGERADKFRIGDKVTALVNGGGYAQYCLAHQGSTLPVPGNLTMLEAASLPETFFTVWHNVFQRAKLKSGEWLLVHGGSSGIGVTAIQLAKAFGSHVIVTAGSTEKCNACLNLGADLAINYNSEDYVERIKHYREGKGVDVILDMVGGDYIERNFQIANPEGRIVQIAFLKGAKVELNLTRLMLKRLTLSGSTLRSQSQEVKNGIADDLIQHVWPLIETGAIKPVIDRCFDLKDVSKAHIYMEQGKHVGKIMVQL